MSQLLQIQLEGRRQKEILPSKQVRLRELLRVKSRVFLISGLANQLCLAL